MRVLLPLLLLAAPACTRANPAFGAGDTETSDSGKDSGPDPSGSPSGNPSSDSLSGEVTSASATTSLTDSTPDSSATALDTLEPPDRGCCMAHDEPGCDDPVVEGCVCEQVDTCCTEAWTEVCVIKARSCSTECMHGTTGTSGPSSASASATDTSSSGHSDAMSSSSESSTAGLNDCCSPNAMGGCPTDGDVESCACDTQPGCCKNWDAGCVMLAENMCGLICG